MCRHTEIVIISAFGAKEIKYHATNLNDGGHQDSHSVSHFNSLYETHKYLAKYSYRTKTCEDLEFYR